MDTYKHERPGPLYTRPPARTESKQAETRRGRGRDRDSERAKNPQHTIEGSQLIAKRGERENAKQKTHTQRGEKKRRSVADLARLGGTADFAALVSCPVHNDVPLSP